MKFLDAKAHGIIDFVFIGALALAPTMLHMGGPPANLSYVLAGAVLGLVLLTKYQFGLLKVVPFTVHGLIELASSMALILSPWLLGFAMVAVARDFFVCMGVLLFVVWACTNYRSTGLMEQMKIKTERFADKVSMR